MFISKVIVDNPGINYQPSDVIVDDNLKLILKEDGSVAGVDVVKQVPTDILPTINISTNTGSGAVLRPVMSIERSTREERLIQVIDCILPKENYQILETETTIEPEISAETLVETPVETPVEKLHLLLQLHQCKQMFPTPLQRSRLIQVVSSNWTQLTHQVNKRLDRVTLLLLLVLLVDGGSSGSSGVTDTNVDTRKKTNSCFRTELFHRNRVE